MTDPQHKPAAQAAQTPREPRTSLVVPIRYRYESILDFVESQSLNISRTGMFVASAEALPLGTPVELEICLTDGLVLVRGRATVARISTSPPGMGLRFSELDEASRSLIDRIVDVNDREGRRSTVALDFPDPLRTTSSGTPIAALSMTGSSTSLLGAAHSTPATRDGVTLKGDSLRVQLNPATVSYFLNNPLLNIKLGGFVIPADQDVALGTTLAVTIMDLSGTAVFNGHGKVVAKHERRLGVRLSKADKATLARVQAEVAKLAPK